MRQTAGFLPLATLLAATATAQSSSPISAPSATSTTTTTGTTKPGPPSTLPSLVSKIPTCAIKCFSSAASQLSCPPTDLTCLCQVSKSLSLGANMAKCIKSDPTRDQDDDTDASDDENDDDCDLSDMAGLALEICINVRASPPPADLASATSIVGAKIAAQNTGAVATAAAAAPTGITGGASGTSGKGTAGAPANGSTGGKPNDANLKRGRTATATGLLVVVVAFAVFAL
ncbi:hypothetical protein B0H63DRAFT_510162 [Podospora didyma]|uniref:CFEM domain-containing protein n=1 Tax=Podospora didyma TaxID=330526 RepID=A0AAE0TZF3_9PEZI|nr:hypothetical protein B0H63DRAFT_510162 [Podospora didyma]